MYELDVLRKYMKENKITPRRVMQLSLGVLFLTILFTSTMSGVAIRVEQTQAVEEQSKRIIYSYDFPDHRIAVVYVGGSGSVLAGTAISLYNSLKVVYRSIDLIPVGSLEDLNAIDSNKYPILVYVFGTQMNGVLIGDLVSWDDFASYLKHHPLQEHVLGMGNAYKLYNYLLKSQTNVWIEGTDNLDAQLAYVWCIWSVADILETKFGYESDFHKAGVNVRKLSLKYFADNINDIVQRQFTPVDPIGEEDLVLKQKRFEELKESFPAYIEPKFDIRELPEENRPAMYIKKSTEESLGVGDLLIGLLPIESGLQGPIGGLVDILLEIFIGKVGDEINLGEDAMQTIETAFMAIEAMLGFFSGDDISVESALSTLFDIIKEFIPFPEELEPYVQLIFDAIPLLRGDFSAISDIIGRLLDLVIPEDWGWFKTIINEILSLSVSLIDEMKEGGGNFLDALLSVISERYLDVLIEQFLELLGLDSGDLTKYISGISLFLKTIMDFLASGNLKKTISEYLPQFIQFFFEAIGLVGAGSGADTLSAQDASTWSKLIGILVNLLMSAIGFSGGNIGTLLGYPSDLPTDDNLASIFGYLLQLIDENVPEVTYAADQLQNLIYQVNMAISAAKESAMSSVTDFMTNLRSAIDTFKTQTGFQFHSDSTKDTQIKEMIVSGATMVAGAINGDFTNKDQLPNLNNTMDFIIDVAELMMGDIDDTKEGKIKKAVNNIVTIIAVISDKDELKQYISSTIDKFKEQFKDPAAVIDNTIRFLLSTASSLSIDTSILEKIQTFAEMGTAFFRIIISAKDNSIQGILQGLIQNIGVSLIKEFAGIDISFVKDILEFIFPKFFGVDSADLPSAHELIQNLLGQLDEVPGLDSLIGSLSIPGISNLNDLKDAMEGILGIIFNAKDIFTDGIRWLFGQLMDWVGGQIEQLINMLLDAIMNALSSSDLIPPEWSGSLPVGLGGFSLFSIGIELGLYPHFGFDEAAFSDWMLDIVFGGLNPFSGGIDDFFGEIFSFFELIPTFKAGLEIGGFGTEENPLMAFLLESLGLELEFSGKGWFELELFTLKGGVFDTDNFFKIIEWGFQFTITISRTFTLLDFLTGGTAGALNSIGEYLGLDAITVTVSFGIFLEVVKRAASAAGPEEGSFTLKITLGMNVHIGINLLIVGIALDFTMEIILTFFQDLVNPVPLKIFLEIILRITVTLTFLFADWDIEVEWKPLDPSPLELTPSDPEEQKESGAMGLDADQDGISDVDEEATPGLNPYAADTDGDGLSDKFETQTSKTDPILPDTDGDGLDDFIEYENTKTNPRQPDTDWDGLTDYEEAIIIGTDPLDTDTDEDGIDDYYEVNHAYDIKGVTRSVEFVMIGGVKYTDRTDPLNPDTDGDGLLDGEEGEFGPFYGLDELYNETQPGIDTPPIIFNGGYTHPLDNDTDDDTWEQLYDGMIAPSKAHAWVKIQDGSWILTTDWWEVKGMPIVYMVEGEPVLNITYTNPCNPDTDGDTGIGSYDRTGAPDQPHDEPPVSEILNSDGYELSLDPPSDPCDADTDDDGLIDGLEGTRASDSNHTHYNNPDTDGDGLGDLQELLLGSDPRHPDSDRDMVIDGDEYFKYGTHPHNPDTDYDGLLDGEELYWFHTNPFSIDSDGDRIGDWMELNIYFTDPMDEDSDNDRLDDYEEIFIYRTKPDDSDTDSERWNDLNHNNRYDGLEEWDPAYDENGDGVWNGDYLRDGDEVYGTYNGIKTDPLKWDTDMDSITYYVVYPGGKVDMTFRLSDGDELYYFGTNPTYGDTDLDGLTDGWELYLASGLVPKVVYQYYQIAFPIKLNPLNNDTDGDLILDGAELMIGNQSSLIYPYVGFFILLPYNTSPVLLDTDGDFLNDSFELRDLGTRPDVLDTDNDTLSDYDEHYFHLTDPLSNDTDADGLLDCNETTAVVPVGWGASGLGITLMGPYNPFYPTYADDPDTDDDGLPDGAEIMEDMPYGSNPMVWDSIIPGRPDGSIFDSDHDGISDGLEYFGDPNGTLSPTVLVAGGGPFNPDSDRDGLLDGAEWQIYGTNASNWDTDNDTFSDGLEILAGTDPLTFTNATEMYAALDIYRDDLLVTSPIDTIYDTTTLTVTVANFTFFGNVQYQFVGGPTDHLEHEMKYKPRKYQWESEILSLSKGIYTLEVSGTRFDGSEAIKRITFYILTEPLQIVPFLIGGVIGFGMVSLLLYLTSFVNIQQLLVWKKKEGGL
ncbi:MAG: hypothetical protein EAX86_10750 [Candidatus Heimdallarchaeota archaeon]|nr:hypothetical protein [Candidatus Heimdallarchaeota archaeon]